MGIVELYIMWSVLGFVVTLMGNQESSIHLCPPIFMNVKEEDLKQDLGLCRPQTKCSFTKAFCVAPGAPEPVTSRLVKRDGCCLFGPG